MRIGCAERAAAALSRLAAEYFPSLNGGSRKRLADSDLPAFPPVGLLGGARVTPVRQHRHLGSFKAANPSRVRCRAPCHPAPAGDLRTAPWATNPDQCYLASNYVRFGRGRPSERTYDRSPPWRRSALKASLRRGFRDTSASRGFSLGHRQARHRFRMRCAAHFYQRRSSKRLSPRGKPAASPELNATHSTNTNPTTAAPERSASAPYAPSVASALLSGE